MNIQQIPNELNLKKSWQLVGNKTKMNINCLRTNENFQEEGVFWNPCQSETNKQDNDEYSTYCNWMKSVKKMFGRIHVRVIDWNK